MAAAFGEGPAPRALKNADKTLIAGRAGAMSAYVEGLKLLARRELSVEQLRARLRDRNYPPDDITNAITQLLERGALDDARLARTHARTSAAVKGRGRLRVARELHEMGIERPVAAEAIAEVFGETDERTLIAKALQKKLRGRTTIAGAREHAQLYRYLMRQGFAPGAISQALRKLAGGMDSIE